MCYHHFNGMLHFYQGPFKGQLQVQAFVDFRRGSAATCVAVWGAALPVRMPNGVKPPVAMGNWVNPPW